ncbi:MAG: BamA/TamA family outer membrane protein [Bacteroidota bacterium]
MKEDQTLLFKQQIKGTKQIEKFELEALYQQKPNRRFPIPYVWLYQVGLKSYDTAAVKAKRAQIRAKYDQKIEAYEGKRKKVNRLKQKQRKKVSRFDKVLTEGNQLMQWGEPLAIYDSSLTEEAKRLFKVYLNSKGYFQSKVGHSLTQKGKRTIVTYEIDEGEPYIIDTLFYRGDSVILQHVKRTSRKSPLKVGRNYDQSAISKERTRINDLLNDKGYYGFNPLFIDFDVDTAFAGSKKVAIRTNIKEPTNKQHKVYKIDEVNFTTDANVTGVPDTLRQRETFNRINYYYFKNDYRKKVLNRRIFISVDSLYSKSNTLNTQRQLANLDNFRFINVNYDTTGGKFVANIYTSPLDRYQWSNELGVNVTQGFPGPFYNTSFKKRNVFGGLEVLEISGRFGIEGVISPTDVGNSFRSLEIGGNISLTFPEFLLPLSEEVKIRQGRINPKTKLTGGFSYVDRPEYERTITNFSNTYSWENKRNIRYSFSVTDLSIIDSDSISIAFQDRLEALEREGNNLIRAFEPSFVSSMIFTAAWNFNSYGFSENKSAYLQLSGESGGTSLNIVPLDSLFDGLEHYQFVKFRADYRKNIPISENTDFAYRINGGLAVPYGENEILPYEKYFFAGGSNGIRAWRPRRLGPGSFTPTDSLGNLTYQFEQQGEILLEASFELRKNLFGFVDYALFADLGNVWTIREDESREGAQFEVKDFFKEIAVGAGAGLRFDFSFVILRLDAGFRIYDPARPEGKRFILDGGFRDPPFDNNNIAEPVIINIGIGYPF